jgi:hypothetical protein
MVLKLFKAVWVFSLLSVLGSFMYVYASLPENVILQESGGVQSVSREVFFYIILALLSVFNMLVFVFSKLYSRRDAELLTWFYGQIITLNIFFVIALSYASLYNSSEKFDYSRIGWVIYGSVALMVIWALAWPVYAVVRKMTSK